MVVEMMEIVMAPTPGNEEKFYAGERMLPGEIVSGRVLFIAKEDYSPVEDASGFPQKISAHVVYFVGEAGRVYCWPVDSVRVIKSRKINYGFNQNGAIVSIDTAGEKRRSKGGRNNPGGENAKVPKGESVEDWPGDEGMPD